jgi:hypothetical protein
MLWNLAATTAANGVAVAVAGAICPLVELLSGGSEKGKEKAAVALCCLVDDKAANKAAVEAAGAIPFLGELLSGGLDEGSAIAASTLRNLAHDNAANTAAVVEATELLGGSSDKGSVEALLRSLAL